MGDSSLVPLREDFMEEVEEVQGVFNLIDAKRYGHISEAALAQALLSTSLMDEAQARTKAADAVRDGRQVDVAAFRAALQDAVDGAQRQALSATGSKSTAAPSMGAALLYAARPGHSSCLDLCAWSSKPVSAGSAPSRPNRCESLPPGMT